MRFKIGLPVILIIALFIAGGCRARKAAGTKATVASGVAVPPSRERQADTAYRTPSPRITPGVAPNNRPKPVPDTQPPVPPME